MTQQHRARRAHKQKLNKVSLELRDHVNEFLKAKGLPLTVHSLQLTDEAPPPLPQRAGEGDPDQEFKCCIINGKFVCGPQCP